MRKLSDMKAAAAAAAATTSAKPCNEPNNSETVSESKSMDANTSNSNSCPSVVEKPEPKATFIKAFSNSNSKVEYVPEIQTEEERIEFQKKMQEKLQAHLAAEGKLYPKPKPSPAINSATGFANDGSFLEMFKRMQQQITPMEEESAAAQSHYYSGVSDMTVPAPPPPAAAAVAAAPIANVPNPIHLKTVHQLQSQPVPIPVVGRRRGGKILKTGIVKKQKPIEESYAESPNDAWNLYLQEVKKYKNASCDADSKTRPLVK